MPEKETDETANILTARSAILDFYSDRATSFASFFVASMFGLVTMLAIVQWIDRGVAYDIPGYYGLLISISIGIYVLFAKAGHYVFSRFVHYANIADKLIFEPSKKGSNTIRRSLLDIAELEKLEFCTEFEGQTNLREYLKKRTGQQEKRTVKKALKNAFDFIYFILVVFLGTLVFLPKIVDVLLLFLNPFLK